MRALLLQCLLASGYLPPTALGAMYHMAFAWDTFLLAPYSDTESQTERLALSVHPHIRHLSTSVTQPQASLLRAK